MPPSFGQVSHTAPDTASLLGLGSSKLAKAVGYAVHQRPFVDRCFTDGRFEIDNGEIERTLKEPWIGRRNFPHTGSVNGGKRLATAYTLVQSCRALDIPVNANLIDTIEKLDSGWPLRRLSELIPDQWARARGLTCRGK
ncbi:MAG: IS66 family transposase [Myxococcales bacterium]|nr:IS66 family transposase [Myxococcales bacterium]